MYKQPCKSGNLFSAITEEEAREPSLPNQSLLTFPAVLCPWLLTYNILKEIEDIQRINMNERVILINLVTSNVSAVSSCLILYVIFKSGEKLRTPLNRLLAGLSIADLFQSISIAFGRFSIKFEDGLPVPISTVRCDTQGFFMVIGSTMSPFYNCSLCINYLAKIRYSQNDDSISRRLEPFLHFVPIAWSLFGACYALSEQAINPYIGDCWIHPLPFDCMEDEKPECTRGKNAVRIRWIVSGAPLLLILLSIIILMSIMFIHVRNEEARFGSARSLGRTMHAQARGERETNMDRRSNGSGYRRGILRQSVTNSRRVLHQAFAYVFAFAMSLTFVYINAFIFLRENKYSSETVTMLVCIFYPLQGEVYYLISKNAMFPPTPFPHHLYKKILLIQGSLT